MQLYAGGPEMPDWDWSLSAKKEDNNKKYPDTVNTQRLKLTKRYSDYMSTGYDVFIKESNIKIGWVHLIDDSFEEDIEIQYLILENFRRNGYCTEAVEALIKAIPDLSFYVDPVNKPSKRVCRKLKRKLKKSDYRCYKYLKRFIYKK